MYADERKGGCLLHKEELVSVPCNEWMAAQYVQTWSQSKAIATSWYKVEAVETTGQYVWLGISGRGPQFQRRVAGMCPVQAPHLPSCRDARATIRRRYVLLGGGVKPRVLLSGRRDQWKSSSGPQPRPNISLLQKRRLLAGGGAFTLDLDLSLLQQEICTVFCIRLQQVWSGAGNA